MARPKKQAPQEISDDTPVTMTYKQYMIQQNWLASALVSQKSIATKLHTSSSSALNTTNTILSQLQSITRNVLESSKIDEEAVSKESFASIHELLHTDKSEIQEMQLPADLQMPVMNLEQPAMVKGKAKKVKKPKDPNEPKRPLTAYFLFLQDNKEKVARDMPDAKPGEIQKKVTEYWHELPEPIREQYKAQYRGNWDTFKEELATYLTGKGEKIDEADLQPSDDEAAPHDAGMVNGDEPGESSSVREDQPKAGSDDRGKTLPTSLPNKRSADDATMAARLASTAESANAAAEEPPKKRKKKSQPKSASPEVSKKEKPVAEEEPKKEKKKKRKNKDAAAAEATEESPPKKKKKSSKAPERVAVYGSDY
ncbi:MAG: hypothetical protein M1828_002961 [Chrysothrix sp. TS-e1954]|nr:MAG: hypothetical protein M1828_002961 [Chrysothrix sp. TS-e1954]